MLLPLHLAPALILQNDNDSANAALAAGVALVFMIVACALALTIIAGLWTTFTKAGQPGWGALIPIYNNYIMTQVADKPGWWVLLMLIPLVNIVIMAIVAIGIAENFGKSAAFGIGLLLLPFIFYPILGFGDAAYTGFRRS